MKDFDIILAFSGLFAVVFGFASCNPEVNLETQSATYTIKFAEGIANGTVTAEKTAGIKAGENVSLTVIPEDNYRLSSISVTDAAGNAVPAAADATDGTKFSFTMPASDVTVKAVFEVIYRFHETVTSAGTVVIDEKEFDLVYFGDWPQTIKAENVTVDEYKRVTIGSNIYYLGDDDNYYAKCIENSSNKYITYSDGSTAALISANSTRYFKVEPIKWRVLTKDSNGKALLFAESILMSNDPNYCSDSERVLNGVTIYPNNYKYSNIRSYLNGTENQFVVDGGTATEYDVDWTGKGFLQNAFTLRAQNLIQTTIVDNSEISTNPETNAVYWSNGKNIYACENTEDKIYLLSEKEATTTEYGFTTYREYGEYAITGNSRIRMPTDYAKANYSGNGSPAIWWWLRSPCYNMSYGARDIDGRGYACNYNYVNKRTDGIVPALTVTIEN